MIVNLITHRACLGHCNPPWHPESPARLEAVEAALSSGPVERGVAHWVEAPRAAREDVLRVHAADHIARFEALDQAGGGALDPDTYLGPGSLEAAWRAAGAAVRAAELALAGGGAAFCPVRPPGHHATPSRAMGFCLFNNVAVAAMAARRAGARRVLIVDWDLHHGNGTQDSFWNDPDVLYFSTHQYPFYPGTGGAAEVGGPQALGHTINVPWPAGCGDAEYLAAFDRVLLPIARRFAPDLVLVSAGFDAAAGDPLGEMRLTPAGYAAMTQRLRPLAGGRLVLALEGGYNLDAIARSAEACLRVLLDEEPPEESAPQAPLAMATNVLDAVQQSQGACWPGVFTDRG